MPGVYAQRLCTMQSQPSIHSPSPRGRGLGLGIENLLYFIKNRLFLQSEMPMKTHRHYFYLIRAKHTAIIHYSLPQRLPLSLSNCTHVLYSHAQAPCYKACQTAGPSLRYQPRTLKLSGYHRSSHRPYTLCTL